MIKLESNDDYHSNPAISRSGLWTLLTRSPFHLKFRAGRSNKNLDIGTATHIAVLQPDEFSSLVMRGPEDRRGNKWREASDEAVATGRVLLTSGDYDDVVSIAETASSNKMLQTAMMGYRLVEASIYGTDLLTDVAVKVKPDLVNLTCGLMIDIKTTSDASPSAFAKSVATYGYHMQQAMYMDVFNEHSGHKVEAFIFVAIEKPTDGVPPIVKIYELDELSAIEGDRIYRLALDRYKECSNNEVLTAYGDDISTLTLPPWAYNIGSGASE